MGMRSLTLREVVLMLLREQQELTYPELLVHTRGKPEELRNVLSSLEKENKIRRETTRGKLEVYSLVRSFLERFAVE